LEEALSIPPFSSEDGSGIGQEMGVCEKTAVDNWYGTVVTSALTIPEDEIC